MVFAAFSLRSDSATVLDVFFWLLVGLVVSGIAPWPSTGRDQRAELKLERPNWADRLEFEPAPPEATRASLERGARISSSG